MNQSKPHASRIALGVFGTIELVASVCFAWLLYDAFNDGSDSRIWQNYWIVAAVWCTAAILAVIALVTEISWTRNLAMISHVATIGSGILAGVYATKKAIADLDSSDSVAQLGALLGVLLAIIPPIAVVILPTIVLFLLAIFPAGSSDKP